MIKACLGLLAGAYALHFSSFAASSDLILPALLGFVLLLRVAGGHAAFLFAFGMAVFAWHTAQVIQSRLQPRFEGDSMVAVVRIIDFPQSSGNAVRFFAEPVDDSRFPARIRLSWYQPGELPEIGDVWRFELRLRRPRGTSNPGVFDYETWLFRARIGATGYVVGGKRNERLQADAGGELDRLRKAFVERLSAVIDDREAAAVIAAISVGARHLITPEQWLRYAQSGTSHLMAISGLHVGLVATVIYLIVLAICAVARIGGNYQRTALLVSLAAAAAYSSLSGFAVPAQRATLMMCLLVLVLIRFRQASPLTILSTACFLVVINDPLSTLAPGFKLSFTAVLLLLWFARRGAGGPAGTWLMRAANVARQLGTMQMFLLFGLAPLTVAIFHRVAIVAPIVNFMAVPVFSIVTVPFALAGFVLDGPFVFLGDAALRVSATSIQSLEWLIDRSLSIQYSDVTTSVVEGAGWFYLLLVLPWVLLPPGWPGRNVAWLAVLAVVTCRIDGPPDACVDVRMLDVGQGLAVVVRTRQRTMLYDTGPSFRGGASMMDRVVLPYLSGQGIDRIDRLVVSHSDLDHAGGVDDALAGISVGDVIAGESIGNPELPVMRCHRGAFWKWNGVGFRVLHPAAGQGHDGNDASCVIVIEAGTTRLWLTGDIEAEVERALLRAGLAKGADVVVVPHHGSETSSSRAFIKALAPAIALVSAGHGNRWGLPRPEVVSRWQETGSEVYLTATDGAVGLRLCDDVGIVDVTRHRQRSRRVWHESSVR